MSADELDPEDLDELPNVVDAAASSRDEAFGDRRGTSPIADAVLAGMLPVVPRQRSHRGGSR